MCTDTRPAETLVESVTLLVSYSTVKALRTRKAKAERSALRRLRRGVRPVTGLRPILGSWALIFPRNPSPLPDFAIHKYALEDTNPSSKWPFFRCQGMDFQLDLENASLKALSESSGRDIDSTAR